MRDFSKFGKIAQAWNRAKCTKLIFFRFFSTARRMWSELVRTSTRALLMIVTGSLIRYDPYLTHI